MPSTPSARRHAVSRTASANFALAKVLAIFMVATGHWFGGLLWVPVTIGLFIFAFSSGYFTAAIYGVHIARGPFWKSKFERLGVRYWLILLFLAVLLAARGRTVWHWHSLVHAFGLRGVLNWAGVRNQSSLGGGLWFFTLLLLFYAAYPYLARAAARAGGALLMAGAAMVAAVVLQDHWNVGHELWLTAAGFITGVAAGMHRVAVPRWLSAALMVLVLGLLGVVNVLHISQFNSALIAAASLAVTIWLVDAPLPTATRPLQALARLDRLLLEIFLIHTYLFMHPTGHGPADFLLSLGLIVAVAWVLNRATELLTARLFVRPAAVVRS